MYAAAHSQQQQKKTVANFTCATKDLVLKTAQGHASCRAMHGDAEHHGRHPTRHPMRRHPMRLGVSDVLTRRLPSSCACCLHSPARHKLMTTHPGLTPPPHPRLAQPHAMLTGGVRRASPQEARADILHAVTRAHGSYLEHNIAHSPLCARLAAAAHHARTRRIATGAREKLNVSQRVLLCPASMHNSLVALWPCTRTSAETHPETSRDAFEPTRGPPAQTFPSARPQNSSWSLLRDEAREPARDSLNLNTSTPFFSSTLTSPSPPATSTPTSCCWAAAAAAAAAAASALDEAAAGTCEDCCSSSAAAAAAAPLLLPFETACAGSTSA
ncbi:hypothetical protein COO60DRAFT_1544195 [Scenedesmus sp. NREL 46B-D3]|nr:hypothetical protein COO60DRAFT_1544195 [Scenedesmus sp. NREL 46B-D3]